MIRFNVLDHRHLSKAVIPSLEYTACQLRNAIFRLGLQTEPKMQWSDMHAATDPSCSAVETPHNVLLRVFNAMQKVKFLMNCSQHVMINQLYTNHKVEDITKVTDANRYNFRCQRGEIRDRSLIIGDFRSNHFHIFLKNSP